MGKRNRRIVPALLGSEEKPLIHFLGICGAGMSAVALLARKTGCRVSGSDEDTYPPVSEFLRENGIPCLTPHRPENVPPDADLAVVGKHISSHNPELAAVREKGIPVVSFPELMGFILKDYHPIVITGTWGKTSITALTAWIFEQAGLNPGYFIGGIPLDLPSNTSPPGEKGNYFILEGDEYPAANFDMRSKFLFYRPSWAVVTSLEWDHINVFPSPEDYRATFERFVELIPRDGYLLLGETAASGESRSSVIPQTDCTVETYGESAAMDWSFRRREGGKRAATDSLGRQQHLPTWGKPVLVDIFHQNRLFLSFRSRLIGTHNIENALAAVALAHRAGIPGPAISAALESHRGVKRRQEVIAEVRGILFINDLAHHPSKVRATLAAVRETFPARRIWAVFEPSTYSTRNRQFLPFYSHAFTDADRIVLMPVPNPEQISEDERITTLDFKRTIEVPPESRLHPIPDGSHQDGHPPPTLKKRRHAEQDDKEHVREFHSDSGKAQTRNAKIEVLERQDDLPAYLAGNLQRGDIALFMSSGSLGKHIQEVIRMVSRR